jgi:negative regulator of sigma E activity
MNDDELHTDDAALRSLLKRHARKPPADDVDWSALHARITTTAAPQFRRRPQVVWWQQVAGWSPRGIPLAAAAAAALAIVLGTGIVGTGATGQDSSASFLTLEEELAAGSVVFLAASDDVDAVIDALLFYDMEE